MSAAAPPSYAVDDVVGVDDPRRPGRWRIKSKGPKNYRLAPLEHQSDRDLMCPPYMLTAPPEPSAERTAAGTSITVGIPYRAPFACGQIVVVTKPVPDRRKGVQPGTTLQDRLMVVLEDKGKHVNAVELGGMGHLYRRMNPAHLALVDADDFLGLLLGATNVYLAPESGIGNTTRKQVAVLREQLRATLRTERGE